MKRRAFLKGAASTFILPSMGILLGKQQALAREKKDIQKLDI